MNKTDQLNAAMKNYDMYNVDPDNTMMLSTSEYAKAVDEDVDTLDEDNKNLRDLQDAIEILDYQISLIKSDIEVTEKLVNNYLHNYQMRYEYQREINELNHELSVLQNRRNKLYTKYLDMQNRINTYRGR